jgi:carboxylesterase
MSTDAYLPDAEPYSAAGGPYGALVIHGFTGSPQSMKPIARALAAAGFAVELPLLPGHGTRVEEMVPTRWSDWSGAIERAYEDLRARCEKVVLCGLSMGGTLGAWLGARHQEIAGIALVNPLISARAPLWAAVTETARQSPEELLEGIGSDIALEGVVESAYRMTPVKALVSLSEALDELEPELGKIVSPLLLFVSPNDHVVDPESAELLAQSVSGPVRTVALERSYHVATIDHDRDLIASTTVEFALQITGSKSAAPNPTSA